MAWVPVDIGLAQNPKTKRFARKLDISIPTAIGHLTLLWCWTLNYAPDGNLSSYETEDIAEAAQWNGDPDKFLDAMINCGSKNKHGFIEITEDGMFIHDWYDYGGHLSKIREQSRQRQANFRKTKKRNASVTPSNAYTGQKRTEEDRTEEDRTVQDTTAEDTTTPPPAPAAAEADAEKISELWNEILAPLGFPRILKNTSAREKSFKARIKTSAERKNLDWWQKLFERIALSVFLRSKNWFTLDWLLNENNLVKLLEGKYDNRESPLCSFDEILAYYSNPEPAIDAEYSIIRGISPYD